MKWHTSRGNHFNDVREWNCQRGKPGPDFRRTASLRTLDTVLSIDRLTSTHHLRASIHWCSFHAGSDDRMCDRCTIGLPFKTSVELYLALYEPEMDCEKHGNPSLRRIRKVIELSKCPSLIWYTKPTVYKGATR